MDKLCNMYAWSFGRMLCLYGTQCTLYNFRSSTKINMKCPYKTDHEQSHSILACRAFDHTHSLTMLHRIVNKSCKQTSGFALFFWKERLIRHRNNSLSLSFVIHIHYITHGKEPGYEAIMASNSELHSLNDGW